MQLPPCTTAPHDAAAGQSSHHLDALLGLAQARVRLALLVVQLIDIERRLRLDRLGLGNGIQRLLEAARPSARPTARLHAPPAAHLLRYRLDQLLELLQLGVVFFAALAVREWGAGMPASALCAPDPA